MPCARRGRAVCVDTGRTIHERDTFTHGCQQQHGSGRPTLTNNLYWLALAVCEEQARGLPERAVRVCESNGWDVHVGRFTHRLVVDTWVSDDEEARLEERFLDLVSEGTRGVATGDGACADVVGELEHGAGAEWTARDRGDVFWVFDSGDNTGSEEHLFPSFVEVDDVGTIELPLENVRPHCGFRVLGPNVGGCHEELGDILREKAQRAGKHRRQRSRLKLCLQETEREPERA